MGKSSRDWSKSKLLRGVCMLSQLYAVSMVTLVPVYCVYVVTIRPESDPLGFSWTVCVALVVVLYMLTNWVIFRRNLWSSGQLIEGGSGSSQRELSHCPICQVYVWRRDHHCFFLGGCVGLVNLLNFVAFCFYACIGTAYAALILFNYLHLEYRQLWSRDFIYYFVPFAVAKWLGGQVALADLAVVTLFSAVIVTTLSTLSIFLLQIYLIYSWKTSFEFWRLGSGGSGGGRSTANFEKVFGRRWLLAFLLPILSDERDSRWDHITALHNMKMV